MMVRMYGPRSLSATLRHMPHRFYRSRTAAGLQVEFSLAGVVDFSATARPNCGLRPWVGRQKGSRPHASVGLISPLLGEILGKPLRRNLNPDNLRLVGTIRHECTSW
jgi:hypothetical protein